MANEAWLRVREARGIFDDIRLALPLPATAEPMFYAGHGPGNAETLQTKTLALLQRMQAHEDYFDSVSALRAELSRTLKRDDCPPLSELLNLRRDIWAAADVLLIDDPESFGDAFAQPGSYHEFSREAEELLFKRGALDKEDPIDLRIAVAGREMEQFVYEVEKEIEAERERERLPTVSEIISYPVSAIKALPRQLRAAREYIHESYTYLEEMAGNVRGSPAIRKALGELRRARKEFPERFSRGLERATGLARETARDLSRHYDFLIAAHKLRTRYEAMLRRAPELSEKGRQFIARLELERRSEQFRLRSAGLRRRSKRWLVRVLGAIIVWLERLRDRLIEPEQIESGARRLALPGRRLFLPAPLRPKSGLDSRDRGGYRRDALGNGDGRGDGRDDGWRWFHQIGRRSGGIAGAPGAGPNEDFSPGPHSPGLAAGISGGPEEEQTKTQKTLARLRTLFGQRPSARRPRFGAQKCGPKHHAEQPSPQSPEEDNPGKRSSPEILPPLSGSQAGGLYDREAPGRFRRRSLLSRLASVSGYPSAWNQEDDDQDEPEPSAADGAAPLANNVPPDDRPRWWHCFRRSQRWL